MPILFPVPKNGFGVQLQNPLHVNGVVQHPSAAGFSGDIGASQFHNVQKVDMTRRGHDTVHAAGLHNQPHPVTIHE